jgi:hypothetical protein
MAEAKTAFADILFGVKAPFSKFDGNQTTNKELFKRQCAMKSGEVGFFFVGFSFGFFKTRGEVRGHFISQNLVIFLARRFNLPVPYVLCCTVRTVVRANIMRPQNYVTVLYRMQPKAERDLFGCFHSQGQVL